MTDNDGRSRATAWIMRLVTAAEFGKQQNHFSQSLFYRRLAEACRLEADAATGHETKRDWLGAERAWQRLASIPVSMVPGVVLEAGEHCPLWMVR